MHAIQIDSIPRHIKAPARMLLLMLASHANNETGKSFPAQSTLADECGMTVRSVQRNIAELVDAGLLKVQNRTVENAQGNPVKMTNIYTVLTPRFIGKKMTPAEERADRSWSHTA